jgi:hypothetical protein
MIALAFVATAEADERRKPGSTGDRRHPGGSRDPPATREVEWASG